jgi:sterol desaturase/sphingolipid hydroxylase (fatty acid hydroxylase superfamily)
MTMLGIFAVLALAFFLAERVIPARPQPVFRRGFVADVVYVPIHYFMRVFINGTVAILLVHWAGRIFPSATIAVLSSKPLWVQVAVLLLVLDFFFYVMHRLKHRWHWWWRLHETHHSSMDLDWLSTVRFHPLEKALDRLIYLFPLVVLGVSDGALLIWAAVDAFWGMLIHSNLNLNLGPLIYVFNGPELHRWHHSPDSRFQRCNFSNNFSLFDWLFGTAYLGSERTTRFGLDDPNYPETNVWRQFVYAFRPAITPARP